MFENWANRSACHEWLDDCLPFYCYIAERYLYSSLNLEYQKKLYKNPVNCFPLNWIAKRVAKPDKSIILFTLIPYQWLPRAGCLSTGREGLGWLSRLQQKKKDVEEWQIFWNEEVSRRCPGYRLCQQEHSPHLKALPASEWLPAMRTFRCLQCQPDNNKTQRITFVCIVNKWVFQFRSNGWSFNKL